MLIIDALVFFFRFLFFFKVYWNPLEEKRFWRKPSSNSQLARRHSFTLNHGNQNLGQPSLTRDSHLHTKKKKYRPPHCFLFFPFGFCELCLALCQKNSLCFSLLCHISSIGMRPPVIPDPSLQPHSIMAVKENKAGTISLMRSRAQSVGKKLLFHAH